MMRADPPARGRFITFEGGEGAGKSSQILRLTQHLQALGLPVLRTREPGGTPGAEAIRALLVTGEADRWDATTELLLVAAARRDHVRRVIAPALKAGTWVVCDRFADSTRAYQGVAGGLGLDRVDAVNAIATDGLEPDLTVVLDIDPAIGLARAGRDAADHGETRFESHAGAFHDTVRTAFRQLAARAPERCVVVDATPDSDTVAAQVRTAITDRLQVA